MERGAAQVSPWRSCLKEFTTRGRASLAECTRPRAQHPGHRHGYFSALVHGSSRRDLQRPCSEHLPSTPSTGRALPRSPAAWVSPNPRGVPSSRKCRPLLQDIGLRAPTLPDLWRLLLAAALCVHSCSLRELVGLGSNHRPHANLSQAHLLHIAPPWGRGTSILESKLNSWPPQSSHSTAFPPQQTATPVFSFSDQSLCGYLLHIQLRAKRGTPSQ